MMDGSTPTFADIQKGMVVNNIDFHDLLHRFSRSNEGNSLTEGVLVTRPHTTQNEVLLRMERFEGELSGYPQVDYHDDTDRSMRTKILLSYVNKVITFNQQMWIVDRASQFWLHDGMRPDTD